MNLLNAAENYQNINATASNQLFQGRHLVRVYQNPYLAIYDIAVGLQQYLSHRNYLAVARQGTSLIDSLMPLWLRQSASVQQKGEHQNWVEFIESLNSETNFLIWSSENEITGEIIVSDQDAEDIHSRLAKKRIFSIQITQRIDVQKTYLPYSVIIARNSIFDLPNCFVCMSDKMKAPSMIGIYQAVSLPALPSQHKADLNLIEQALSSTKSLYFQQFAMQPPKIHDRIVFAFKDLNAFAIQQDLGLSDEVCLAPAQFPFWVLDTWKTWWKESETEAFVRGLLIVSVRAFQQDPQLTQKIISSVDKIRRLGQWNVLP